MDALQRWLTLLTLISAALAALLYLARQVWRGFRLVERLSEVVQHELSPNTGSSMKDDVAAIAVAVGKLQGDVAELTTSKETAHEVLQLQLETLQGEIRLHHPDGPPHDPTHKREKGKHEPS